MTLGLDWRPNCEFLTRCSFNFCGKGKRALSLKSSMEEDTRKQLYAWIQDGLNSKMYQEQHPDMGPFSMRPLGNKFLRDGWIRAQRANLEILGEPNLLSGHPLQLLLHLHGVTEKKMKKPSRTLAGLDVRQKKATSDLAADSILSSTIPL